MRKIWLIIQREYLTRVRKKTFIVMTLIGPLLFAGIMVVPVWLASREGDHKIIRVLDESSLFSDKFVESGNIEFIYTQESIDKAKKSVSGEEIYGLLHIPLLNLESPQGVTLFSEGNPSLEVVSLIERTLKKEIESIKLKQSGIDAEILEGIKTKVRIQTINLSDSGEKVGSAVASTITGYLSSFLIYFFIFYYGTQVMRGVMDEKTSRIVEVIISSVTPFQLMMGKIVGIAGVGLTQFFLWVILTFGISSAIFSFMNLSPQSQPQIEEAMQQMPPEQQADMSTVNEILGSFSTINIPLVFFCFLFFFLGSYLLYASLFAMVGSAVDSEADTQQFMLPIMLPLLFSIVVLAAVLKEPNGSLAFWMSIIPFTSPVVMMMRVPFEVPLWELGLSMVLLIAGFIFTTWFAGRIYRVGILMHGSKVNYRVLAKWFFTKI